MRLGAKSSSPGAGSLPKELFRAGERLLDALKAENRLNVLIAKKPHDGKLIAQWQECHRHCKKMERDYWELTELAHTCDYSTALCSETPSIPLPVLTARRIQAWLQEMFGFLF